MRGSVLLFLFLLFRLETDTEDRPLFSISICALYGIHSCNKADPECNCANAPDAAVCESAPSADVADGAGGGIISRCTSDPTTDFQTADPTSCVVLAYIWQPEGNHNGGK